MGYGGYGSYICDKCGQHMYVWSNIHQKSVTSFMDAPLRESAATLPVLLEVPVIPLVDGRDTRGGPKDAS